MRHLLLIESLDLMHTTYVQWKGFSTNCASKLCGTESVVSPDSFRRWLHHILQGGEVEIHHFDLSRSPVASERAWKLKFALDSAMDAI